MASGDIKAYSQEWYEMQAEINGVQESIIKANTSLIEYQNSLRQLEWDSFDRLQEKISNITEESDFLISLMENSELYDDKGQLSDTGMATMGLHAQNYNVYMAQADKYAEEMQKIEKELAKDEGNQDLIERRQELLELQQDSILAANDEKEAIRSLVEEGINRELESLQDLIDKYNETLDNAKDLYDYQKNIESQTKEIASLQKQKSAYSGDTSEETQAKLQKIVVQLQEAEDNLEETEMEHAINEQKKILDSLYSEYEQILNTRLDNIDALLNDMIDEVNASAGDINKTLISESEKVGYTMTEGLQDIWSNEGCAATIITKYGEDFCDQLTSVNYVLKAIGEKLGAIEKESDKKAVEVVKEEQKPAVTTPSKTPTEYKAPVLPTPTGDGVPKVGDKVTFESGQYYYSSDGTSPTGSQNLGKSVYITNINNASWAKKPYHISTGTKLGSGDLGWVSLDQLKGYSTGGLIDYDGLAAVHGGKKPELVLNSTDTENLVEAVDTLRKLTKEDSALFDDSWVKNADSLISNIMPVFNSLASKPNVVSCNTNQNMNNVFNMTFELHDVTNGEDVVNYLIKSDRFENAVKAMTIDRLAGGSKFSKNKYFKNN